MNVSLTELAENVRKLNASVGAHIGSRDKAHAVATFEQNGFMSFDDKNEVDMRGEHPISVDDGFDILSQLAGLYIGKNFKNAPALVDDSICIVKITGVSNYKIIEFQWITGRRVFYRFIYSNTDSNWLNDKKWVLITPLNGASGYIATQRYFNGAYFEVALRMDINISFSTSAPINVAILPSGYTTLDSNADYFTGIGLNSSGTYVPVGVVITGGNTLSIFRMENGTDSITKVRAYIHLIAQNSTTS